MPPEALSPSTTADAVAALFAVDPAGLGGVVLRAGAGPARDAWAARLAALLPADAPSRRIPLHIGDDRLLGGLDLAQTLQAGRVVAQRGLLAAADGGVVWLAMAERLAAGTAARLAAVLDTGELVSEREGLTLRSASRFGVVAFDEGIDADEAVPARLSERLAFWLALAPRPAETTDPCGPTRADVSAARALLPDVTVADDVLAGLCAAALALGIDSVRAPLLAVRAARAAAALAGRREVSADDAAGAARLVLAPRATRLPVGESGGAEPAPSQATSAAPDDAAGAGVPADGARAAAPDDGAGGVTPDNAAGSPAPDDAATAPRPDVGAAPGPLPAADAPTEAADHATAASSRTAPANAAAEVVLQAALAAIPPHLLDALTAASTGTARAASSGRGGGSAQAPARRGRPSGVRRAEPRGGARLNLVETLRAAAPWQALRRREAAERAAPASTGLRAAPASTAPRVIVRRDDFHVTRYRQRRETTTVFVVDASGSAALHRLAEAKGAVELLLADCYVRRDSVAVIAFRGRSAELLLPPTRSLARAKRSLAGLPGGGGTPLAAGIDAATALGDAVRRRGAVPLVVLLTDGRGNIALDGSPGRAQATRDAHAAAARLRTAGFAGLVLDTSAQPQDAARCLAAAMGASYLPLPHADAGALSRAMRDAAA